MSEEIKSKYIENANIRVKNKVLRAIKDAIEVTAKAPNNLKTPINVESVANLLLQCGYK